MATRRTLVFGLILLVLLLSMQLAFPWRLVGIAIGAVAAVVGLRALVAARRARTGGMAVPALVIGLFLTGWLVLQLVASAAFWSITAAYQECRQGAITLTAQEGCTAVYQQSVQDRLGRAPSPAPSGS